MITDNVPIDDLPDYKLFCNHNKNGTLSAYGWMTLSPDSFLGAVSILFPKFILFRGGVFFAEGFNEQDIDKWFEKFNGDAHLVEKMANHRHAKSLLQFPPEVNVRLLAHIATVLKKTWELALLDQFPAINCTVDVCEDENDYLLTVYTLLEK